jgi:hypothetical protein
VDIGAFEAHPTVEDLASQATNEETALSINFNVGDAALGIATVTASSNNSALFPNDTSHVSVTGSGSMRTLTLTPETHLSGLAAITLTVTGTNGRSMTDSFQVMVTAVNDAPVKTVPGAQATVQQTLLVFSAANSNAVSVADMDAGTDAIKVTLTTTNGTVTLGSTAGLSFVTGDGTDDASVSFMGTLTAVNAALNGLSFKPASGFSGAASLQLVTDDQGHNGSGGALSDTDSINITVMTGGAFRFSSSLIGTQENVGTFSLLATRSGGSAGAATVDYATAFSPSSVSPAVGGSACTGNVDYISTSGTLSFADGEASKTISITICSARSASRPARPRRPSSCWSATTRTSRGRRRSRCDSRTRRAAPPSGRTPRRA